MTTKEIDKQIEELKQKRLEIEKKEASLEENDEKAVATYLHSKLCHYNHTDGCSWGYESWDDMRGTKLQYLQKAVTFIKACKKHGWNAKQAIDFLNELGIWKY